MAEAVVIGSLELDRVTGLTVDESRKLAFHPWPGADGDLVQDLGMAAARVTLTGVASGENAGQMLEQLREVMRAGEPVDFAASAAVAANIDQVLVSALRVVQPPGRPDCYEYQIELVRYTPPPEPATGGFSAGALSDIGAQVDAAAADAVSQAAAQLGNVEGKLAAIDDALQAASEVVETLEGAAGLAQGLLGLKPLVQAVGEVVKASGK